jgi:large subunit ribosomal protein L23
MILKPISTEKAVMMIEKDNLLTFSTDLAQTKDQIKKEVEELFDVKVEGIRTLSKKNKKYCYVKLNKKNPAIDVASKLGLI